MNLIIDANIFHKFFDLAHKSHNEYQSVYKCLFESKGIMYIGGSKFEKELLNGLKKYRGVLLELNRRGRLKTLVKDEVDREVKRIESLESSKDFDDPHLLVSFWVKYKLYVPMIPERISTLKIQNFIHVVLQFQVYTGKQAIGT